MIYLLFVQEVFNSCSNISIQSQAYLALFMPCVISSLSVVPLGVDSRILQT